jgi:hypothetical protein
MATMVAVVIMVVLGRCPGDRGYWREQAADTDSERLKKKNLKSYKISKTKNANGI